MHMKKLAVACTLALGTLAAGGAQAAFPYDAVQVDMFLSGASAVQNNFKGQLSNLFLAGYKTASDNTTTNGADFFAVTGTFKSAAPVPAALQGKTARITYRTRGGSVWGVDPVAREEQVQWMKMDSATCSATLPAGASATADLYCSPTGDDSGTNGRKPDLGVSDVEPKMFQGPLNVEFGKSQLNNSDLNGLKSSAVYQQAFGVPLTNAIPTSLFVNRPMVVSLVSKKTVSWLDIKGLGSTAILADPINSINPGQNTVKPVVVCRRVQGSGTQATANFFINQFGCSGSAYLPPARMSESDGFDALNGDPLSGGADKAHPIIIDPTYGYTVVENPGSGDVRSCLTAAQNGTNHTFKGDDGKWYQVTFSGVGTNSATTPTVIYTNGDPSVVKPYGAVGVLSYDSAGKESGWHYQDLNGVLTANAAAIDASGRPAVVQASTAKYALAAMMEGSWDYFSEVSMQYRNGLNGKTALTDTPTVDIPTGKLSTGALKTLADQLVITLGDPAVMNTLKSYKLGIAALPSNYTPDASVTTNLVSKGTKSGDTCNPNTLFFKPQAAPSWQ